jgi:hypothetical protein
MKLYMFRTVPLSITRQWYMSYRFVDSFRAAGSAQVPSWSCSKAVYKPVWHISLPDDGQRNFPKYVEFHFQNKFEKLVHQVGFIIRKFVTLHGHVNVNMDRKLPANRGLEELQLAKVHMRSCCARKSKVNLWFPSAGLNLMINSARISLLNTVLNTVVNWLL